MPAGSNAESLNWSHGILTSSVFTMPTAETVHEGGQNHPGTADYEIISDRINQEKGLKKSCFLCFLISLELFAFK